MRQPGGRGEGQACQTSMSAPQRERRRSASVKCRACQGWTTHSPQGHPCHHLSSVCHRPEASQTTTCELGGREETLRQICSHPIWSIPGSRSRGTCEPPLPCPRPTPRPCGTPGGRSPCCPIITRRVWTQAQYVVSTRHLYPVWNPSPFQRLPEVTCRPGCSGWPVAQNPL